MSNDDIRLSALEPSGEGVASDERVREIERLTENARQSARLMMGYHQLCKEHGFAPSSKELIDASDRAGNGGKE